MKQNKKFVPFCLERVHKNHKDSADMEIKTALGAMQELSRYFAQRKKH